MCRRLFCVFSVVLVLSLVGGALAQDPDVTLRMPDADMPVIDGVIDEIWSASTEQTISTLVNNTAPTGPADCSGTWKGLWDWDYIYVLVVVRDEILNNDSGDWNDDCVEFYIDGDNSKGSSPDENDHQYTSRWNNAEVEVPSALHNGEPSLVGFEYAIVTTGDGYIYEARIPWTSIMGQTPTAGQLIGIEVFVNDDDDGTGRDSQIAWFGTEGAGWNTPSMWATGLLIAGNRAGRPNPADGSLHAQTWASVSWLPGPTAVSHDVYFGDNFDDVNDGAADTFQGNQTTEMLVVGFPGFPFPDGLTNGSMYYWRIDEVAADGTVYKGDVWSFSIPPKTAYSPDPADGAEFVDPDATLTWTGGFGAKLHHVYIGESYADVDAGTPDAYRGPVGQTQFDPPGDLEAEKVLYWRVDEFDSVDTAKGDVWGFTTPGAVGEPQPANRAADAPMNATLSWTPADNAASHQVYFGTDADTVRNADATSPEYIGTRALGAESYDPGKLAWNTGYFWRVDEVYTGNTVKGLVWSFATADFIGVDDFESYNDTDPPEAGTNRIFDKWIDGFGTATNGALVGNDLPPYAGRTIVHGGLQSMPYSYDNNMKTSEATLTLVYPKDWTDEGVTELSLWFVGKSTNAAERMFVALNGTAVVYHDDPTATQNTGWAKWVIDLTSFAGQGVNLANVNTTTIGFGTKNSPAAGGSGQMYFDDIQLNRLAAETP